MARGKVGLLEIGKKVRGNYLGLPREVDRRIIENKTVRDIACTIFV